MGFAVGCIGMSYDDFCGYDFDEFDAICKAYNDKSRTDMQEEWERMRMLATINIQPHIKNNITPRKLLPFPWDSENKEPSENGKHKMTMKERRRRFEEVKKKLDKHN